MPRDTSPGGRATILVVDSDRHSAGTLGQVLRGRGHKVELAHDASSALAAFDRSRPDIVLLDTDACDSAGERLAHAFPGRRSLAGTKVIAMSRDGRSSRGKSAPRRFAAHLRKPLEVDVVFDVLDGVESGATAAAGEGAVPLAPLAPMPRLLHQLGNNLSALALRFAVLKSRLPVGERAAAAAIESLVEDTEKLFRQLHAQVTTTPAAPVPPAPSRARRTSSAAGRKPRRKR